MCVYNVLHHVMYCNVIYIDIDMYDVMHNVMYNVVYNVMYCIICIYVCMCVHFDRSIDRIR